MSLLERPRRRWEDNITIDLKEIGRDNVVWVNVDQERTGMLSTRKLTFQFHYHNYGSHHRLYFKFSYTNNTRWP